MRAGEGRSHFQEFHTLPVTSYWHQAVTRWFDEAGTQQTSRAAPTVGRWRK